MHQTLCGFLFHLNMLHSKAPESKIFEQKANKRMIVNKHNNAEQILKQLIENK